MKKLFKALLDPRLQLYIFLLLAIALQALIWLFNPVQSPVVLYKLGLAVLAAIAGMFFDFAAYPFARPDSYLDESWQNKPDADNPNNADYPIAKGYESAFNTACIRRAVIVVGFVLAVALGL